MIYYFRDNTEKILPILPDLIVHSIGTLYLHLIKYLNLVHFFVYQLPSILNALHLANVCCIPSLSVHHLSISFLSFVCSTLLAVARTKLPFLEKINPRATLQPSKCSSGCVPQRTEDRASKTYPCNNVHGGIIHNSQK